MNTNETLEKEALYDKKYTCPICGSEIKAKTVRTGKCKLESTDSDLRPVYQNIDSLKYDALLCESCGYASLKKFFDEPVLPMQVKNLKDKIASNYKSPGKESEMLTYDDAIRMHKLALLSSMVKEAPMSEQGYTSLKIAWLLRGKAEGMPEGETASVKQEELSFLDKTYFAFDKAYQMEEFPMCGMDEPTFCYLLAMLGYETEHYKDARQWLAMVMNSREASARVKDRARDLKELLAKVNIEE